MREPSTLETRREKQATKQKGHAPELFRVVTATELADAIESGDVPGETKLLVLVAGPLSTGVDLFDFHADESAGRRCGPRRPFNEEIVRQDSPMDRSEQARLAGNFRDATEVERTVPGSGVGDDRQRGDARIEAGPLALAEPTPLELEGRQGALGVGLELESTSLKRD